ncbi:MAG: hypothetical protein JW730_06740 [Anaerolineales bacterium]|nr:hypothetical protein [Anaerolineales bacterium]
MEKRKINSIVSLLLTTIFLTACSFPTSAPTVEPQVTEPESPQTEAPAASEGGLPVQGEGLCSNAYYPVRQGATWNYKSTGSPAGEYSFTDTISAVRDDGFTLSTQFNNLTRTQEWACREEGLVALQFGGAPAALLDAQNMQLSLEVNNVSGVTFPDEINAGDQWQHNLDLQGSMTILGQQGTAEGNAQTNFTAVGNESVTVPAGTFDAMKIQIDTTLNMTVSYQGLSVPVSFSGPYTYWFVQGVGWVKASGTGTAEGTSFSETIELQSYSIP